MAITIMGGLIVATLLTLVVVPALYALMVREPKSEALAT
jgi:multidrug efflux pump subunit AcrB